MASTGSPLFPELFGTQPTVVRNVLRSALRLNDLQNIYAVAQKSDTASLSRSLLDALNITIQVSDRDLARIPQPGPLLVVANHPFGLLDGMVLDQILCRCRNDSKILANEILCGVEELRDRCILVDVSGEKTAHQTNVMAVRHTVQWLRQGHAIGMFPAGEVSHWQNEERCVTDAPWGALAIRCARKTDASVVPVYFLGGNSLTFQLAGLLHPKLRTARLPIELLNKRASRIEVRIGNPVSAANLFRGGSEELATQYVRARVYMLGCRAKGPHTPASSALPTPRVSFPGVQIRKQKPVPAARQVAQEIARLQESNRCIVESDNYAVFAERGDKIPLLLTEIGRLRELTFREAGEGTGKALDLDTFDSYYTHLILWHKKTSGITGSYRLAWTNDVLPERDAGGLYTSRLFRYSPAFFTRLGRAVELGRSFIVPDHQKDYAPLLLLWQAIARCVAQRPEAPVLFGAVSISAWYTEASRNIIVDFLKEHSFRPDLAGSVVPRRPFRSRLTRQCELPVIAKCLHDVDDLPISDIEPYAGVPVLLRQYLRLGGRVAAFNVDAKFSNVLDALLVVDLRETSSKLLGKYMGSQASERFLKQAAGG